MTEQTETPMDPGLHALFHQGAVVLFRWEAAPGWPVAYVSPNVEQVLGFAPEALTGGEVAFESLIHPDDLERVAGEVAAASESGAGAFVHEPYRLRRADGGQLWVYDHTCIRRHPDGTPEWFDGYLIDVTAWKTAEERVHQRDQLIRRILDSTRDHVALIDSDGTIVEVNRSWREFAARNEAPGDESIWGVGANYFTACDHATTSTDGEDAATALRFKKALKDVLAQDISEFELEYPCHSPDKHRWFHGVILPVQGAPGTALVIHSDITRRREAEAQLAQSEQRNRAIVRALPDMVFRIDRQGNFRDCQVNDPSKLLMPPEDFIGKSITETLPASLAKLTLEVIDRALNTGEMQVYQYALPMPAGILEFESRVVMAGKDEIFAIVRDVTKRVRAEENLRRMSRAMEQVADSVVMTDVTGAIVYVNPSFERVTGYSRDEVLGQNPRLLKSGQHGQEFYEKLWGDLTEGRTWQGRLVNRRKDGQLIVEDTVISPVRDGSGHISHFVAVRREITRELELEERLRLAERLEGVGRLAGGVAHDLNNLLSPILGYTDLLLEESAAAGPSHEWVREIKQAGLRARELVRQLLAFSRKQTLELKALELNEVLGDMEKLLRGTVREEIALDMSRGSDIRPIRGDRAQLERVILNLVINAEDAITGQGTIGISTENATLDEGYAARHLGVQPGEYVMLSVSDTGMGMGKETADRVFDPFYTTKAPGHGTGLGLSTAYGIVKQHGGNIWVYSEPGRGTTFKVYLPVAAPGAEARTRSTELAVRPETAGDETILVVEDNDSVREVAAALLECRGYKVITAATPLRALELLEDPSTRVDLLLTDVIMPEMNGRELYERVLALRGGMRVIFMSGHSENIISRHGVLDENVHFLVKPLSGRELAEKVRKVLDERTPYQ